MNLYQTSKVLLLSLENCTASNTILEALATGCPISINNIGAVKYYITELSKIPIFEKQEVVKQCNYMKKLLDNVAYAEDISRRQRVLALDYSWNIIANKTEEFILN